MLVDEQQRPTCFNPAPIPPATTNINVCFKRLLRNEGAFFRTQLVLLKNNPFY